MMHFIDKPGEIFQQSLVWLSENDVYSVDTETTGLDPITDKVLLLQIGNEKEQWVYDVYRMRKDLGNVLEFLADPNKVKIFHNAQFDYKMIKAHFKKSLSNIRCTMIAEQLLNRGMNTSASLKYVAHKYCGVEMDKEERESFVGMNYGERFEESQIAYAGLDVVHLEKILNIQMEEIKKNGMETLAEVEFNVIPILGDMSYNGIYLEPSLWLPLEAKAMKKAEEIKQKLDAHFLPLLPPPPPPPVQEYYKNGKPKKLKKQKPWGVNYNSSAQVLPLLKKLTGIDLACLDAKYLEEFKNAHDAISDLVAYKKELKKISTYGAVFLNNIHPVTQRVHSEFIQIGAETGRLSSNSPNMMNLPKQQEYRTPFCVQDKDWNFISADFSGQELRILAQLSGEEGFIEAIKKGMDLHSYSASLLFNIPYEKFFVYDANGNQLFDKTGEPEIDPVMKKKYRNPCKTITFGLLYGAGPRKLATQLKISIEEAKELMAKYFATFPKVRILMDRLSYNARKTRVAVSPLDGRRVDLNGIDWNDGGKASHALNQAKNLPFQGCGATVTKLALCYIYKRLQRENLEARIVDVIHDEILVECPNTIGKYVATLVEEEMVKAFNYFCPDVPMKVVAELGTHWIH